MLKALSILANCMNASCSVIQCDLDLFMSFVQYDRDLFKCCLDVVLRAKYLTFNGNLWFHFVDFN